MPKVLTVEQKIASMERMKARDREKKQRRRDAIKARKLAESDKSEHQDGDGAREAAEAGGGDSHAEGRKEEVRPTEVTINGRLFKPIEGVTYRHDYIALAQKIASGEWPQESALRQIILNDLWFIVFFVMGIDKANHPFVVNACWEVESGPKTMTLDIWAREHFKSTIITQAETLQYHLKHPDHCTGIFSYVRPVAKAFLRGIKTLCETSDILKTCFPDVLYQKPETESSKWSEDEGLVFKRPQAGRKESTIEAWGLIEGMPTSRHFERRIYDDIETDDIKDSPDMLNKCFSKFEMSDNLGVDGGVERVVGTYYHHYGPIVRIQGKKDIKDAPMYVTRVKSATEDGTALGKPVLLTQERLDKLRQSEHFNSQQLCNPTPMTEQRLNPELLCEIESQFLPKNLHKFLLVDPAGDLDTVKTKNSDAWAIILFGIEPGTDEIGAWKRYIIDAYVDRLSESQAVEVIAKMYLKGGIVRKFAYEKPSNMTPAVPMHVIEYLKKMGRHLSEETGSFAWLRDAGRNKKQFISSSLSWPLNNSKWFISKSVPAAYRERIKQEMTNFPVWHDDAINVMAYLDDIVKDETFLFRDVGAWKKKLVYKEVVSVV